MSRVMIVVGSVRPGRVGLPIAEWVRARTEEHGGFEIDFADLAEIALPFLDEPNHPSQRLYTKQHTFDWSARVDDADAFIFVSPEYNHSFSPVLKNAVDFLSQEWWRKPVAFVSYGGVSAGTRGVVAMEPVLTTVGLVKTGATLDLPFVKSLVVDGVFTPQPKHAEILTHILDELETLSTALEPVRSVLASR